VALAVKALKVPAMRAIPPLASIAPVVEKSSNHPISSGE
jgi:hypothetical protein